MKIRPVEAVLLGYLGIMAAIVVLSLDRLDDGPALLAGYGAAALFVLALARGERRLPTSGTVSFLRFAAPLLVLPFAYAAVERTVLVVHGRYVDDAVRAWETALFGALPNIAVTAIGTPLLTELLTFCYFSFYGCFLIPVVLYARGRRALAERHLFAALTAMLACYLGFITVPLAGPALTWPELYAAHRPSGYFITDLQNTIMTTLDPPGACFPSSHVAGAWITVLCLRRYVSATARRILWTLTIGLTVAVVYDWYHYASDVVAGLAVALIAYAVTERYSARRAPQEPPRIPAGV
ncbi:PAP2 superfamily protein [Nonomuraea solani]|uniref:PAP2 superfamily protein n=1 Tax=Nonomuraea solani TaxID=1144553 RepID=A0A1H6EQ11_9ACTN|nr:phosphatase PAP2 family protein [Nonomuraea solani]SEG99960.1 PAP2 superfamily protein [Nonomuraea solani]